MKSYLSGDVEEPVVVEYMATSLILFHIRSQPGVR